MKRRVLSMVACVMLAVPTIASASTPAWSCPHTSKMVEMEAAQVGIANQSYHNVGYKSKTICQDCKAVLATEYHVFRKTHGMQAVTGLYSPNGIQTWRMICRCCGQTKTETYAMQDVLQSFTV